MSGEQEMTPYDIAVETAKYFGLNEALISKASTDDIKQPAVRPAKTGFNISKAKKELGYQPKSFREGLGDLFGR